MRLPRGCSSPHPEKLYALERELSTNWDLEKRCPKLPKLNIAYVAVIFNSGKSHHPKSRSFPPSTPSVVPVPIDLRRQNPARVLPMREWQTLETAHGTAVKGLLKCCPASTTPSTEFCKTTTLNQYGLPVHRRKATRTKFSMTTSILKF